MNNESITSNFAALKIAQQEAANAYHEAKAEFNRLNREVREAFAQETYGVPYYLEVNPRAHLIMVAPDGSAVYEQYMTPGRSYYTVREPDGNVSHHTNKAKLPRRRFERIDSPGLAL